MDLTRRARLLASISGQKKEAGLVDSVFSAASGKKPTEESMRAMDAILDQHGLPKHPENYAHFERAIEQIKQQAPKVESGAMAWLKRHRGKLGLAAAGVGGLMLARSAMRRAPDEASVEDDPTAGPTQPGF